MISPLFFQVDCETLACRSNTNRVVLRSRFYRTQPAAHRRLLLEIYSDRIKRVLLLLWRKRFRGNGYAHRSNDALYAIDGECDNDHMCGEREKQMKDDIDRELRMRTRVVYLRPFQYGMNHGVEMVIASTDAALDDLVIVIAIVCTERWSPMPLTPEEGKPCP
ncbi:hypothetical protein OUZ56_001621 [Daphnia magna]|uniref:Uncharacterized protein n=1 Tax=Daphnia magna TaxID=35525 RepID=A0ABR0A380_9CRUS|nr:hypothetical protein OUZ56_001621 [Daphnia magna]